MLNQNCVWFEDQTIFGLRIFGSKDFGIRSLGPRKEYSKGLILLQLHYMYNHVSVSRPHGPLVHINNAISLAILDDVLKFSMEHQMEIVKKQTLRVNP